jgi:hypothetical protein
VRHAESPRVKEFSAFRRYPWRMSVGGEAAPVPGDVPATTPDENVSVLDFSGTHDLFDVGVPPEIPVGGTMTLEIWAKVADVSLVNALAEKPHTSHDAPHYLYGIYVGNAGGSAGQFRADVSFGGTRYTALSPVGLVSNDEWNHYAVTSDGATLRLYLNAILVATQAVAGVRNTNASKGLHLGSHGNISSEKFDGLLDEVRLWNVCRTQEQLMTYMSRHISAATGLIYSAHADENGGTTVADATGNLPAATKTTGVTFSTASRPYVGGALDKSHVSSMFFNPQMPTYDGTGESVHPDVVHIPLGAGVGTKTHWLATTPYPSGNEELENPSILSANDMYNWGVPSGLTNPVIATPVGVGNNNSDCSLLYYGGEYYLYYREFYVTTIPDEERIYLVKSSDGVTWGSPIFGLGYWRCYLFT